MTDQLQIPPHSEEAEQSVIGGLLRDNKTWDAIADKLAPEDFYRHDHRLIFEAARDLLDAGKPCDLVTVSEALDASGDLDAAGGLAYVAGLAKDVPTAANTAYYAGLVRDHARRRGLIAAAYQLSTLGFDRGDVNEQINEAQRLVLELDSGRRDGGPRVIKQALRPWLDRLDTLAQKADGMVGLPTGFADLDRLTAGMEAGDLWILAARPSMGKTALALDIARHATKAGTALVFSLEMSEQQLSARAVAAIGNIPYTRLRAGTLEDDDWPRVTAAVAQLANMPLFIDDTPALTVHDMRARARRVKNQHGLSLVVVDYLQLAQAKAENRTQEVTQISSGLKALAKTMGCPVIALSQLSRKVEDRGNKRPVMSDLRESGAIEQDADVIAFLYREQTYDQDFPLAVAELNIEKQRNGPTGQVLLAHRAEQITFADLDGESIRDYRAELKEAHTPAKVARFVGGFRPGRDKAAGLD